MASLGEAVVDVSIVMTQQSFNKTKKMFGMLGKTISAPFRMINKATSGLAKVGQSIPFFNMINGIINRTLDKINSTLDQVEDVFRDANALGEKPLRGFQLNTLAGSFGINPQDLKGAISGIADEVVTIGTEGVSERGQVMANLGVQRNDSVFDAFLKIIEGIRKTEGTQKRMDLATRLLGGSDALELSSLWGNIENGKKNFEDLIKKIGTMNKEVKNRVGGWNSLEKAIQKTQELRAEKNKQGVFNQLEDLVALRNVSTNSYGKTLKTQGQVDRQPLDMANENLAIIRAKMIAMNVTIKLISDGINGLLNLAKKRADKPTLPMDYSPPNFSDRQKSIHNRDW